MLRCLLALNQAKSEFEVDFLTSPAHHIAEGRNELAYAFSINSTFSAPSISCSFTSMISF